jgi:hypothetical protein
MNAMSRTCQVAKMRLMQHYMQSKSSMKKKLHATFPALEELNTLGLQHSSTHAT